MTDRTAHVTPAVEEAEAIVDADWMRLTGDQDPWERELGRLLA